jgi:hypothetical protein
MQSPNWRRKTLPSLQNIKLNAENPWRPPRRNTTNGTKCRTNSYGGLLPDNTTERSGDIFIVNWEIRTGSTKQKDLRIYSKHAIDLSFPLVDSHVSEQNKEIGNTVGIVANKKTLQKLNNVGTRADRTRRGNSFTMKQRCADQDINYWPIPVEGDGQTSTSFEAFINKVSDSASNVGHNPRCFKKRWTTILACTLAKKGAQMINSRTSTE